MSSPLESLEPKLLWSHFDGIRQIPRPSKHEEKISAHVESWAKGKGHEVLRDAAGSLVVKVPATPGHESAPTVIIQGHLDMVCEKNSDVDFDFMKDPIDVRVDGDWVKANGTTLGADNGIGVATALAVADDPEVVHGPLEILCTIDEETGLTGAKALDASLLSGRVMLNLDTEEDGAVYFGCAGGGDTITTLKATRRRGSLASVPVKIAVKGLKGGHSGLNIIENRANAVKMMTRILLAAIEKGLEIDLVSLDGGSKHNAIPREAFAVCRVPKTSLESLQEVVDVCKAEFDAEFGSIDPDLVIFVEQPDDSEEMRQVLNQHARDRLLHLVRTLPHGVLSMSREVDGLVETSNNVAIVKTTKDMVEVTTSTRSSVMPALDAAREQIRSAAELAGGDVEEEEAYPGWKPNPDSAVVKKTLDVYEELFGKRPPLKAIHAGLECGLLIDKLPGLDAVSIGPEIRNAHSPDEMVQISSVQRFYEHVKALLKQLAQG
ncbi:MAG: aminoacyl-histidine dipeptidase [Acidobacteria bacterium]|nr:aminoacyl-histidine dipeptidase [Acidobacteriota bacterium]